MIKINNTVLGFIQSIESASNGSTMRQSLYSTLSQLQIPKKSGFLASALEGPNGPVTVADLVTKVRLAKIFEGGELFDPVPTYNSVKAVRANGIKDWLGDMKYVKEFASRPIQDKYQDGDLDVDD